VNKENIIHGRTSVYNCNYHIVFTTKYRRKVLIANISQYFKQVLNEVAKEKGFIIRNVEIGDEDHIHIFASAHPKTSPSYIVKMIKGISARLIFLRFPELKHKLWKGHLWNPSYYIETIGSVSESAIKKYIDNQKSKTHDKNL
jgi:putative transposase